MDPREQGSWPQTQFIAIHADRVTYSLRYKRQRAHASNPRGGIHKLARRTPSSHAKRRTTKVGGNLSVDSLRRSHIRRATGETACGKRTTRNCANHKCV